MSDERTVVASAHIYVPAERCARMVELLLDWSHDEGARLAVVRTGPEELSFSTTFDGEELANGTVSAVTYLAAILDRALAEVSEFRWFGGATLKASLRAPRDQQEPQDGDERIEDGITMRFDGQIKDWVAVGEARSDPRDGNTMVKFDEGDEYVRICDIFGGHHRTVDRDEWESWMAPEDAPADVAPRKARASLSEQVAVEEDNYEREHPPRRPPGEF